MERLEERLTGGESQSLHICLECCLLCACNDCLREPGSEKYSRVDVDCVRDGQRGFKADHEGRRTPSEEMDCSGPV